MKRMNLFCMNCIETNAVFGYTQNNVTPFCKKLRISQLSFTFRIFTTLSAIQVENCPKLPFLTHFFLGSHRPNCCSFLNDSFFYFRIRSYSENVVEYKHLY